MGEAPSVGIVYLVGAGPGDPGLLTVRGQECLRTAEVVIFDRLVAPELLQQARLDAELIDAGKHPGEGGVSQSETNRLLVDKAREGRTVCRLKGGDPFVYGRGGEEAEALAEAGIPFEVVPGVTSATAVPAYAGIPITHRQYASSFAVITGHQAPIHPEARIDWERLALGADTLVILMGVENLALIVQRLLKAGRRPETPIALIRWGTVPQQETLTGTLADIEGRATAAQLQPPAVIVVGEVVRLRERLRWFDRRPLFGKRVLVTRSRHQASQLSELLRREGAQPLELPTIAIEPLADWADVDRALTGLGSYGWLILTSVNAVEAVWQRLQGLGLDARAFHEVKLCAIGSATAAALAQRGLRPEVVPQAFTSDGVVQALRAVGLSGTQVLLPRADIATADLARGLRELGAQVHELTLYRTSSLVTPGGPAWEALREGALDAITFTSSSTVRGLMGMLERGTLSLKGIAIASIGPVTSRTARELGLEVHIEASEHTVPGLVRVLREFYASPRART